LLFGGGVREGIVRGREKGARLGVEREKKLRIRVSCSGGNRWSPLCFVVFGGRTPPESSVLGCKLSGNKLLPFGCL